MKIEEEEDFRDMHTVRETNKELATPIYSDIACKMGKEWDFNWNLLYQFFTHKYYLNFPFDEGFEK